jgi:hypothetical protein
VILIALPQFETVAIVLLAAAANLIKDEVAYPKWTARHSRVIQPSSAARSLREAVRRLIKRWSDSWRFGVLGPFASGTETGLARSIDCGRKEVHSDVRDYPG